MTKLQNIKYKLGKGLAFAGLAALPFAGCDKTKDDNGTKPTETQKKHNVELVYGKNEVNQWQNIAMDTIYKYNAEPTVDTIYLVLEVANQFSTYSTNQLKYITPLLRERHNVNPNKVFGKGEMELRSSSVRDNQEIVIFMRDTMGYNVTCNTLKKIK